MIWHIFKKDLRITWPLAVLAAAAHWTIVLLALIGGFSGPALPIVNFLRMLILGGPLASGLLIIVAVHVDAIPGVGQDWLVRPIRRLDLLLAKLLFAALVVQIPILLADFAAFLLTGFPPTPAFAAAAEHSLLQMVVINIPFVAFAALTRNLLEAVSGAVVIGLIVAVSGLMTATTSRELAPISRSGFNWVPYTAGAAVMFFGAAWVLWLQYFSRRTAASWASAGAITVLFSLSWFMPWRVVFATQKLWSGTTGSSQSVALDFEPAAGRFQRPAGGLTPEDALALALRDSAGLPGAVQVYFPVRVTGLPPDSAVQMDHAEVRLIANGHHENLDQEPWNAKREGAETSAPMVYPRFAIPAPLYERMKSEPVRIEADYWLTLARVANKLGLPATGASQNVGDAGRCHTNVNDRQTGVQLSCAYWIAPPPCFHLFLEDTATGQRNPDRFGCFSYGSFARLVLNPLFPQGLMPFNVTLPFRDPAALAHYPVDGSRIRQAQAVYQAYQVQDHFTLKLVIADVRLADWEAELPQSSRLYDK
jgi:hypothetical protein